MLAAVSLAQQPLTDSNLLGFSADLVKGAIGNDTLTERYQVFQMTYK